MVKAFGSMRQRVASQRGDTIVEVLLALAILGAVLGGAYVVTNRNMITNRVTQERLEAVKIAEGQLERLRHYASQDDPAVATNIRSQIKNFCFTNSGEYQDMGPVARKRGCVLGDLSYAETDGRYVTRTRNIEYIRSTENNTIIGDRYHVLVEWDNIQGNTKDTVELYYEVYRP